MATSKTEDTTGSPARRSAGILSTKRRQLHWPTDRDFRILSLDGGGIKGLFTVALLSALENAALGGRPVGAYFDLIAGTSTGGIIALGLASGRSASEILDVYVSRGNLIFPRKKNMGWVRPAFRPHELARMLKEVLQDRTIGDATTRLCIPSCEGRFGDVNVFKTPHHPDFKLDWKVPMAEAGMATSAAPTFLPVHIFGEYFYVDGGVWANNPCMVAVVDALTCYSLDPKQIRLMSIGTGARVPALNKRQLTLGGLAGWAFDGTLAESFMHYASLNATGQAGLLMGRDRLARIEPQGQDALVHMSDYATARKLLVPAGQRAAERLGGDIIHSFFQETATAPTFFHGPLGNSSPDWAA